jgi:hypothetical protein
LTPVIVPAASMAFTIASSVACTVATKSGLILSFASIATRFVSRAVAAPAFAVENAMKMSPELLPP